MSDPEQWRVTGDPELTADARVYEITSPDERNPDYPVRYRIDMTLPTAVVLSYSQPGPLLGGDGYTDMFITLEALEELGRLAALLRAHHGGAA
jgi:hypothetical protein